MKYKNYKYNFLIFVVLMLSTLILNSCRHEAELPSDLEEVCFSEEVMPVIVSNCATSGCHDVGGTGNVSLTDYNSIVKNIEPGKPFKSKLYKAITKKDYLPNYMPPKPNKALSSEQIRNIYVWILQDAKNTTCTSACDTNNYLFNQNILPIVQNNCSGCHGESSPSAGISITNYYNVKTIASNGSLLGTITSAQGFSSMPKGYKLADCKIIQIKKWIQNGTQNN